MKFLSRLSLLCLMLCVNNIVHAQDNLTKEVQLNNGGNQVRTEIFVNEKKVKVDNNVTYFWFKAREIHFSQGGYAGNLLNGEFSEFYPSEQLKEKGTFKNGLKNGEWKSWFENGILKEISYWRNGYIVGKRTEYNEEGKIIFEGNYSSGKLSGTVITVDENGNETITKYKKGVAKIKKIKRQKTEPVSVDEKESGEKKKKGKLFTSKKTVENTPNKKQKETVKKAEEKKEKNKKRSTGKNKTETQKKETVQ